MREPPGDDTPLDRHAVVIQRWTRRYLAQVNFTQLRQHAQQRELMRRANTLRARLDVRYLPCACVHHACRCMPRCCASFNGTGCIAQHIARDHQWVWASHLSCTTACAWCLPFSVHQYRHKVGPGAHISHMCLTCRSAVTRCILCATFSRCQRADAPACCRQSGKTGWHKSSWARVTLLCILPGARQLVWSYSAHSET